MKETLEFAGSVLYGIGIFFVLLPFTLILAIEHAISHNIRKKKSWLEEMDEDSILMGNSEPCYYDY